MENYGIVTHRSVDNSYIIEKNGFPYHVPNEGTYKTEWEEINKYVKINPDKVTEEEPYSLTFEEMKHFKIEEINNDYNLATFSFVAAYPLAELLTFSRQEQEARAYSADPSISTPFLTDVAKARGIPLGDLVTRVLYKSETFAQTLAVLTGQRQKYIDMVNAAQTIEEINSILPKYTYNK